MKYTLYTVHVHTVHTYVKRHEGAMGNVFNVPWSWSNVRPADDRTKVVVFDLDRAFAAKDIQVHYAVTILLVITVWALLITIHVVEDLEKTKNLVVTVFSLLLVALTLVVSVRRVWIIKYNMLHPAIQLLTSSSGSAVSPRDTVPSAYALLHESSSTSKGTHFFGTFVGFLVVAVGTLLAATICLVMSTATVGVGIALAIVTTALFIAAVAFYRHHAGVHLNLLNTAAPLSTPV